MNFTHLVKTTHKQIFIFLELIRFFKPTGTILLFLPCAWVTLFLKPENMLQILGLFFLGSFAMRSAGCIVNDLWDVEFDKKVKRTKNRVLAAGKLSKKIALLYLVIMLLLSLMILLQFNNFTIFLGFLCVLPVIIYPAMKRITNFPQIFLGIVFNAGVLLSWAAIKEDLSLAAFLLYLATVVWTIFYDIIYAMQDIKDDKKIGVKSMAVYLGQNVKKYLTILAILHSVLINLALYSFGINQIALIFINSFLFVQILWLTQKNAGQVFGLSQIYGILVAILIY